VVNVTRNPVQSFVDQFLVLFQEMCDPFFDYWFACDIKRRTFFSNSQHKTCENDVNTRSNWRNGASWDVCVVIDFIMNVLFSISFQSLWRSMYHFHFTAVFTFASDFGRDLLSKQVALASHLTVTYFFLKELTVTRRGMRNLDRIDCLRFHGLSKRNEGNVVHVQGQKKIQKRNQDPPSKASCFVVKW
jgi:hypothetical protein